MKSFADAYKDSKKEVIERRKMLLESQKISVVEAMKAVYGIQGKISDMPKSRQAELAKDLLEYWDPKDGITKAGEKLINESKIQLHEGSSNAEVEKYIKISVHKNYGIVVESFRNKTSNMLVESLKDEIEKSTKKRYSLQSIRNFVWNEVKDTIKEGF